MPIAITCSGCKAAFDVPDNLAGKTIRCTSCQAQMSVPAAKPFGWANKTPAPAAVVEDDDEVVEPTAAAKSPVATKPAPAKAPAAKAKPVITVEDEPKKSAPKLNGIKGAPPVLKAKGKPVITVDDDDDDDDDDDAPRRSKKKKPAAAGGSNVAILAGGGLALCAVIGVGVWLLTKDKKPETASNTTSTTPANSSSSGPGPDIGPRSGGSTAGAGEQIQGEGFTAQMPGKPTTSGTMSEGLRMYQYSSGSGPSMEVYIIGVLDIGEKPSGQAVTRYLTEHAQKAKENLVKKGPPGATISEKNVTLSSFPGKEISATGKGGGMMTRVYVAHDRIYHVTAGGNSLPPSSSQVQSFFSAFKITYTGSNSSGPSEEVANSEGGPGPGRGPTPPQGAFVPPGGGSSGPGPGPSYGPPIGGGSSRPGGGKPGFSPPGPGSGSVPEPGFTPPVGGGSGKPGIAPPGPGTTEGESNPNFGSGPGPGSQGGGSSQPPGSALQGPGGGFGGQPPGSGNGPRPGPGGMQLPGGGGPGLGGQFGGGFAGESYVAATVTIDPFYAVAFDEKKKEVYTIGARQVKSAVKGTLHIYTYPEFKDKAFNIPYLGTRAVVDSEKQLLYVAVVTNPPQAWAAPTMLAFDRNAGQGRIQIFDLEAARSGTGDGTSDLKPIGEMQPEGIVRGLELSPDGKSLFALTCANSITAKGTLVQFSTADRKITKKESIPAATSEMKKSADGKSLLIVERGAGQKPNTHIQVIDMETLARKPIQLAGNATDVTPFKKDGQLIALVAPTTAGQVTATARALDADGSRDIALPAGLALGMYVTADAEGKYLFVGSPTAAANNGFDAYEVTDLGGAGGIKKIASIRSAGDRPLKGSFHLAPDGEHLIFHSGVVVKVADLKTATPAAGGLGAGGGPGAGVPQGAFNPGGGAAPPQGAVPPGGGPGPGAAPPPKGGRPGPGGGLPPGVNPLPPGGRPGPGGGPGPGAAPPPSGRPGGVG